MGDDFLIFSSGVNGTVLGTSRLGEKTELAEDGREGTPKLGLRAELLVDLRGSLSSPEESRAASGEKMAGAGGFSFLGINRIAAIGSAFPPPGTVYGETSESVLSFSLLPKSLGGAS